MSKTQRILISLSLVLLLVLLAPAAHAGEPRTGSDVVIGANEIINDDVYLSGSTVTIDGTIRGDAVAVARTVIVNGTVEGSLMAAGAEVLVNGQVGRTVRVAGYTVEFGPQARMGRDVLTGAYNVTLPAGATVQGDMWVGSRQATIDGQIGRDYRGGHSALALNGVVKRDVRVSVEPDEGAVNPAMFMQGQGVQMVPAIPNGFRLGATAQIGGVLRYASPEQAVVAPGAQLAAPPQYEQTMTSAQRQAAQQVVQPVNEGVERLLAFVRNLVTLLLIGLLLVWLTPGFVNSAAHIVATRPLPSVGWGLVALIAVPVITLMLLIAAIALGAFFGLLTLGGLGTATIFTILLAIGSLLLFFFTTLAWFGKIVVGLAIGRLLLARAAPAWAEHRVWPLLVGVTLIAILGAILALVPFLGGMLDLLVSLFGLGALLILLFNNTRGLRPASATGLPLPSPAPAR